MTIEPGQEYEYLGQFVKVLEISGEGEHRQATVETRFAERTVVDVRELSPKRKRKPQ